MTDVVPSPDLASTLDVLRRAYVRARSGQLLGLVAIGAALAAAPRAPFGDPAVLPLVAAGVAAAWFGWGWRQYRREFKTALVAPVIAGLPLDGEAAYAPDVAPAKAWIPRTGFFKQGGAAVDAKNLRVDDMVEGRLGGRELAWCDVRSGIPGLGRAFDGRVFWRSLADPVAGRVAVWPAGEVPSAGNTGDRAFEARYSVVEGEPAAVAAVLTPARRAALLAFPPRPVKLVFDGDRLAVWMAGRPADLEPAQTGPARDAWAVAEAQEALRTELTAAIALVAALDP